MRHGEFNRSRTISWHRIGLLFLFVLTGWVLALQAADPFFVRTPEEVAGKVAYRVFGTSQPLVVSRDGIRIETGSQTARSDSEQALDAVPGWTIGFDGADQDRVLESFDRRRTRFTYIGGKARGGRLETKVWGGIRVRGLYSGIDLEVVIFAGRPVFRIVASKEADLDRVRIQIEGEDIVGI
jgi:hypothetical protein